MRVNWCCELIEYLLGTELVAGAHVRVADVPWYGVGNAFYCVNANRMRPPHGVYRLYDKYSPDRILGVYFVQHSKYIF